MVGKVESVSWDFGDGSTATGSSPSYSYGSSGTYTVTLIVGDGTCSAQVTQNVTVFDMPTVSASRLGYAGKPSVLVSNEVAVSHPSPPSVSSRSALPPAWGSALSMKSSNSSPRYP